MKELKTFFSTIKQGITGIVFPDICICCGQEALQHGHHICPFCLEKRFEYPNAKNTASTSDVILPNAVQMQYALWNFDKGGLLQNLMHHLKYERLTGIGHQLGKALARRVKSNTLVQPDVLKHESLLIPVPLHYLKFRKRGFNQAFSIAKGIKDVLSIPICSIDTVRRTKYTQSQTGFSLQKRIHNMSDAFSVAYPNRIKGKTLIIVDDVFTTGATSFELAQTLNEAGASSIFIWTVAQA